MFAMPNHWSSLTDRLSRTTWITARLVLPVNAENGGSPFQLLRLDSEQPLPVVAGVT